MSNLAILIPSYNEINNLLKIIKKLKNYNVLIVDDGSFKKIEKKIQVSSKLKIVRNNTNKGYEYSLLRGFKILKKKFKYILTMDADGEHSISNINKSYIYCKKNKIDLLIGSRSRMNRFSEKYISKLFFKKYNIRDPLSGFKIYNSKKLSKIIKDYKLKKNYLFDILFLFLKKKYKVKNYNIKSGKIPIRKSSFPNFETNIKILSLSKYLI